jgi:hypothetical protein
MNTNKALAPMPVGSPVEKYQNSHSLRTYPKKSSPSNFPGNQDSGVSDTAQRYSSNREVIALLKQNNIFSGILLDPLLRNKFQKQYQLIEMGKEALVPSDFTNYWKGVLLKKRTLEEEIKNSFGDLLDFMVDIKVYSLLTEKMQEFIDDDTKAAKDFVSELKGMI